MRRGGFVYRWNGETSLWDAAPPGTLPEFMRRPGFTSLGGPAIVLYSLFGAFLVVTLLSLAADIFHFATLNRVLDGESVSTGDRDMAEGLYASGKLLQAMLMLAIGPFFIWWTRRATCNVAALGAESPTFSPGWAIGWWFIPIANWFQPLRVLNQAWRASDPNAVLQGGAAWRKARLTPLIPTWWVAYQVFSTLWSASVSAMDAENQTAQQQSDLVALGIVSDVLMLVAAALAVAVVVTLTKRQDAANRLQGGA